MRLGLATLVCLLCSNAAWPQNIKSLRWGGDKGGGAPFIYEEAGSLKGFEVDLAHFIAEQLSLNSDFTHKSWENLPNHLSRKDIDLILNGYEWTSEREEAMASTIPYYVYTMQLVVRRDNAKIRGWEDLRKLGRKPRVGVLKGSAMHKYLEKEYGRDIAIEALGDEGSTGVMLKVQNGALDATVQDNPPVTYYVGPGREFSELEAVGEAIEPGYYVIFLRHGDDDLRQRINSALRLAIRTGKLRSIYEKHGLWNAAQERLALTMDRWPPARSAPENSGSKLAGYGKQLSYAALITVALSFLSMPLAMVVGLIVAVGRLYGPKWLDWILGAYVEVLRGTPLLLQLFVIYFVLPGAGIHLSAFAAGVLGLAINYSAYEAENYRAGLLAIPRGQMEAAQALGMTTWTALRRIIIPQAVRIVIPPVTNDFIALFKDTSVCSVIAVHELTEQYRLLAVDHPKQVLEIGLMTGALYFLMSYPLSLVARRLEQFYPRATH